MNSTAFLPKAWLIFGPPGSGKGTVGAKLATITGVKHISTGDIFRGLPPSSANGQLVAQFSSAGKLVPDEVTVQIFNRYLNGLVDTNRLDPGKDILLLDGIPRTPRQAELVRAVVDVQKVLVLDIPDHSIIVERLAKRAAIEGRKDDANEAVVRARLEEYAAKTQAVLDCYPASAILRVAGHNSPEEVFCDTLAAWVKANKS